MNNYLTGWQVQLGLFAPELQHDSLNRIEQTRQDSVQAIANLNELRTRLKADITRTAGQTGVDMRNAALQVSRGIYDRIEAERAGALKELTDIATRFSSAKQPKSAAEEVRRDALRRAIASLDSSKRMDEVRMALINRDSDIIEAIATGKNLESQVLLCHFTEAQQAFEEMTSPEDVRLRGELHRGLDFLNDFEKNAESLLNREFLTSEAESTAQAAQLASEALQKATVSLSSPKEPANA